MNYIPDSVAVKRQDCPGICPAGQECAGGATSEHTRFGGAICAAKLNLSVAISGPSSQEFSSSSHHSDVLEADVPLCPPIAMSRGWVKPTGIIWKKALG